MHVRAVRAVRESGFQTLVRYSGFQTLTVAMLSATLGARAPSAADLLGWKRGDMCAAANSTPYMQYRGHSDTIHHITL